MKDQYRDFANNFITNYAPAIFKAFLEQMQPCMAGQVWLSKKVQYQVFAFFAEWSVFLWFT
jgi:importin-7